MSVQILPSTIDESISQNHGQTRIHIIKYIANLCRQIAERIYWIITFTILLTLLGYYVYQIGETWLRNEVMLIDRNRPTPIYKIPFPAVTICPQIKFTKDKLDLLKFTERYGANYSSSGIPIEKLDIDYGKKLFVATQICPIGFTTEPNISGGFLDEHMIDWIDTLMDISPTNIQDIFTSFQFESYDNTLLSWFGNIFNIITNEGVCFTFNTIQDILRENSLHTDLKYHNIISKRLNWEPEKGYTKAYGYPYKGLSGQVTDGLKFTLKANLSDKTRKCNPTNIGYTIALQSPSAYPQMYTNFIQLNYGKSYKIEVIPKTIETSDDLRSVAPDVRQCYFNDERKLQFYTFYNQQNCNLECCANFTKLKFGGVPFSSPRDSNTTIFALMYKNYLSRSHKNVKLIHEHFQEYEKEGGLDNSGFKENCNCLPECNAIIYDHKIIMSVDLEENNGEKGIIYTEIEILFNEPYFMGQMRVLRYPFESLLSDFGGLMGLFIGTSILSLFELVHFVAKRYCFTSNVVAIQN